jgi:hypothetical protein
LGITTQAEIELTVGKIGQCVDELRNVTRNSIVLFAEAENHLSAEDLQQTIPVYQGFEISEKH